jgi:hypothetical protein
VTESERPLLYEAALRLGLVLVAFLVLWRVEEPTILEVPTVETVALDEARGPVGAALLASASGLAAGVLFGLAGRPLSGWTYRPRLPALLGMIPAIVVVAQVLVFSEILPLGNEGLFTRIGFFLVAELPLRVPALMLGVALTQGVISVDEASAEES